LINVTQALGEMAILYPVSGGFYTLALRTARAYVVRTPWRRIRVTLKPQKDVEIPVSPNLVILSFNSLLTRPV
jgi:hypothetical protein